MNVVLLKIYTALNTSLRSSHICTTLFVNQTYSG